MKNFSVVVRTPSVHLVSVMPVRWGESTLFLPFIISFFKTDHWFHNNPTVPSPSEYQLKWNILISLIAVISNRSNEAILLHFQNEI